MQCVVQSYLAWLQGKPYELCTFCQRDLKDDVCIRLPCHHVVHWACLDSYARSLPASTAPAGFLCPVCSESIFPPDNLVSPVADALRKNNEEPSLPVYGAVPRPTTSVTSSVSVVMGTDPGAGAETDPDDNGVGAVESEDDDAVLVGARANLNREATSASASESDKKTA